MIVHIDGLRGSLASDQLYYYNLFSAMVDGGRVSAGWCVMTWRFQRFIIAKPRATAENSRLGARLLKSFKVAIPVLVYVASE